MGGRGSTSGLTSGNKSYTAAGGPTQVQVQVQPQQPQPVNQPTPPADNTPTVAPDVILNLQTMTDDELAQAVIDSKTVQMPNMLADKPDPTQRFIYQIGANEKPMVLDDNAFAKFMQDNGITSTEIMSRSVDPISYKNADGTQVKMSADMVSRVLKYSRLNYIGGKHGGQVYGAGTYFDMNGGSNTGYGQRTVNAVLNPATARVITYKNLMSQAHAFAASHPKFAKAVGAFGKQNESIWAMAMGYNVIKAGSGQGGYHNVIDRRALVYLRDDH